MAYVMGRGLRVGRPSLLPTDTDSFVSRASVQMILAGATSNLDIPGVAVTTSANHAFKKPCQYLHLFFNFSVSWRQT